MLVKQEEGRTSASLSESSIAASKVETPEEANVPRTYEVIDLTMDDDDDEEGDEVSDVEDEESDEDGKDSEGNEDNESNEDDIDHEDTEDNGDNNNNDDDDNNDDDNNARATPCADVPITDQAEAPTTAASISSPSLSLAPERVLSIEPPQKSSPLKKRSRQGGVVDLITHLLAGGGECVRANKARKPNPPHHGGGDKEDAAEIEQAKDNDKTVGPSTKTKKERGKYRVKWKEDSLLEEVRLFHKSEEEVEGSGLGLSHQDEGAVLRRKKEAFEWYGPIALILPPLVEELSMSKVAMAGEGLWFHEEENLHFDVDDPQEMDPECRLGGEHTSLLTETAEIPWPDILLEGMEGVEYPEPMPDSPQQILLPTQSLHRPAAPRSPPSSTSSSLPPPRLRPASPQTQEPRRRISSEGRLQHYSEPTDERQRPGKHQIRRQSTDASYLTSSNRLPLPDRPGMRRYSISEKPQGNQTSTANREHSRRSSPSDRPEREAERVPIPERPHRQGGREGPPCEKSSWEKSKAHYEQREENEPGKRYRPQREEESDWEVLRHEKRDSSKYYHYERRSWRYNEEQEREERHDRHSRGERRIVEEEESRSFRRPSTGERGTHGDKGSGRGGGGSGTTPTTPTSGHKGDVEVPRRHNSLSSHDRRGQHKSDEYRYGSKQSTYWNNNQDVTYPYRPYTKPDGDSERRVRTNEKREGARS